MCNRFRRSSRGGAGSKLLMAALLIIGIIGLLYVVNYAFPEVFNLWRPVFEGPVIFDTTPTNSEIRLSPGVFIGASYSSSGAAIASVTLMVDGVNVTGGSSVGSASIGYSSSFGAGTHSVSLTVADDKSRSSSKSWTFSVSGDVQGAMAQALDEINAARSAVGIQNVSLLSPVSSAYKAEDMLANQYFSHYDLNGYYPGYMYTLMGGACLIEENIGYRYDPAGISGLAGIARETVHAMIYDDALSGWGHRDSLLDPSNNYAEISVASDSNRFFLVVNMVKELVDWVNPPSFSDGIFSCAGRLALDASSIQEAYVYFSNYSVHDQFVYDSGLHIYIGEVSYSIGDPIAGVIPSPKQFLEIDTIRPKEWHVSGQDFSFSVTINSSYGQGIYTVAIFANNTLPIKSPYSTNYNTFVPVLFYAVKLP